MTEKKGNPFSLHFQRNIFLGLFVLIPLWLTLYFAYFIFIMLAKLSYPLIADLITTNKFFMYLISFTLSLTIIYLIGILTNMWLGRLMLGIINHAIKKIPLIGSFYKSLKQLADTFNGKDKSEQKVVLINFPSEDVKTIGFLIKTMEDPNTKQLLGSVFVPTTPNPTSGFLQIIPVEKTVTLDWTFEEAMSFIISGGSHMPNKKLNFR